jgi:tetratricopeptide (TPR) repeat protein
MKVLNVNSPPSSVPMSKDPRYHHALAASYFLNRNFGQAAAEYEKALRLNPDFMTSYIGLTATYSLLGMNEKAHAAAEQLLRLNPNLTLKDLRRSMPYKDPADINLLIDGLQKAGLN